MAVCKWVRRPIAIYRGARGPRTQALSVLSPLPVLSFLAIPEAPGRVCVPSKALLTPEAAPNPLVTPSPHFILMGNWVWVA